MAQPRRWQTLLFVWFWTQLSAGNLRPNVWLRRCENLKVKPGEKSKLVLQMVSFELTLWDDDRVFRRRKYTPFDQSRWPLNFETNPSTPELREETLSALFRLVLWTSISTEITAAGKPICAVDCSAFDESLTNKHAGFFCKYSSDFSVRSFLCVPEGVAWLGQSLGSRVQFSEFQWRLQWEEGHFSV